MTFVYKYLVTLLKKRAEITQNCRFESQVKCNLKLGELGRLCESRKVLFLTRDIRPEKDIKMEKTEFSGNFFKYMYFLC